MAVQNLYNLATLHVFASHYVTILACSVSALAGHLQCSASQTCDRWLNELAPVAGATLARGNAAFCFLALAGGPCGMRLLLSVRTSGMGLHVGKTLLRHDLESHKPSSNCVSPYSSHSVLKPRLSGSILAFFFLG